MNTKKRLLNIIDKLTKDREVDKGNDNYIKCGEVRLLMDISEK